MHDGGGHLGSIVHWNKRAREQGKALVTAETAGRRPLTGQGIGQATLELKALEPLCILAAGRLTGLMCVMADPL